MEKGITKEWILKLIDDEYKSIIKGAIEDYGKALRIRTQKDMKSYLENMELYDTEHYAFDSGELIELRLLKGLIENRKELL